MLIDPNPDKAAILNAEAALRARRTSTLAFESTLGEASTLSKEFEYKPRHRLVLAGRGAIFRSMAQIGKATGYEMYALSP